MTELTEIKGIGSGLAENFEDEGFESAEDVAEATIPELTDVSRVSQDRAVSIAEAAEEFEEEDGDDEGEEKEVEEIEEEFEDEEESDEFDLTKETAEEENVFEVELNNDDDYEWIKYALLDYTIEGRFNDVAKNIFDRINEGNYSDTIKIDINDEENEVMRNVFSKYKRVFQRNRQTEQKNLMQRCIDAL